MITTVCKISYGSQTVPPIVPAVQGDTGRAISFEIADFTPPSGATATYFILKPSGEAIYNSATITDNSILCELTAQSLAEAGENRMQVRVLKGEDIVTSFEVILMVRTFLGDDAMESGTEMNIFDQAVAQATEQFQENAEQIVAEVIESIPADYTELTEEVDELNERIDNEIAEVNADYYEIAEHVTSRNLFNGNATDGYIGASGAISSSTTYKYSDKIDVSEYVGHTLYFGSNGTASSVRFLCAYDANEEAVESAGSNNVISSYTVPVGIKYIVVSFAVTPSSLSVESDYLSSVYTSYYDYNQIKKYPPIDGAINIPQPTIKKQASFTNGQTLSFPGYNSVKRGNQVFSFYCKIPNGLDDNGYIVIGKDSAVGYAFGVSATKWNYFINGSPLGDGALHGLTLKDYLYFRVQIKSDGIAYITIKTNGGTYSRTNTSWSGEHGVPYAYNGCLTTVTNAVFTYTCEDYRHRIWIMGDSYTTIAQNRWTYYLYDWGYNKNILINGYPGEASRMGFFDWRDCLLYGTPSIAIWAYGMNNTDNGAINADWLTYVRLFLKDCEDRNITPILATIPCIPNGDNSYKNAWIRSSGYRYIEFANAVNTAQDATTWYDNMLSTDNVHPDVQGAIALACRAIEDVPELMIN